ncbi:MAG: hypothetical protein KGL35_24850 [Bradyrhizobium sp.]|nr:hypothetical protein [Bradyrhizobium sp.]
MAFGLSGALAGLSAVEGGYQQGVANEYKLDDQKRAALARVAMGNALSALAGGGGGQQPIPPMPQGPQPPFQQGPQAQPQAPPPGQMSQPMQRPGLPQQAPAGGMLAASMAPPGQPRTANGPPGLPGGGGLSGGNQPLDWRTLVAAVKQANPNIPPDVMAEAVNQFLPMMNQQSQMEWRQISLQLREQALQDRTQQFMLAESGRNQRADLASGDRRAGIASREREGQANRVSRETIAKMTVDERREAHEAGLISKEAMDTANREERGREADQRLTEQELARTGRERIANRRLDQQQAQFEQREGRLQEALKLREDSTWARLEQQKQQAIQRAEQAGGKQGLAEVRAIIDAQDKHVRTKIAASNILNASQRKQMLEEADKVNSAQIARLRERFGGSTAGGGPRSETSAAPGGSPPATTLPPEARSALKEGQVTTFQNGQKWTLRNGQPEQVP